MGRKNEVAKKPEAGLPAINSAWGTEESDARDILIPRLLLMQGLSEAVANEKCQMGDIIDSVTEKVVGSGREKDYRPLEIIPFYSFKNWIVYEKLGRDKAGKEKLDFKGIEPFGPENAEWERETDEERRDLVLNFFCLRADQLDDPAAIPCTIGFRRTSYKVGQKLASYFEACKRNNIPPAANSFLLGAKKKENDDGIWYVFDVEEHEKVAEKALKTAYYWYQEIRKGGSKVDNREFEGGAEAQNRASEEVVDDATAEY